MANLPQLQALALVEDLKDNSFLANLSQLQALLIGGVKDANPLKNLTTLKYLAINGDLEKNNALKNLSQLQYLYINGKIEEINFLKELSQLQHLYIGGKIKETSFLKDFTQLQTLYADIEVEDLSFFDSTPNLRFLQLEGEVDDISFLYKTPLLESLIVTGNYFSDISPIEHLKSLRYLDLSYNEISDFTPLYTLPCLTHLNLTGNPITHVPYEIINQKNCLVDLHSWVKDLQEGYVRNYETKLIICGNGRVGKTCIVNRLLNEHENFEPASTQGIELGLWKLPLEGEAHQDQELLINIWDFGGQEIYHSTHRLFMQSRALYIIVWDWESEKAGSTWSEEIDGQTYTYRNHTLSYWLDHIRNFSQDSPVIIVQNKLDVHGRKRPPYQQDLDKMYNIADYRSISAKTGAGFAGLKELIQEIYQEKMPEIGMDMPRSWFRVRQSLRTLAQTETDIPYEQYENICAENGVAGVSCKSLIRYLHQGGVLYYQEGVFLDRIILDQKWALAAIYAIFNRTQPFYKIKKGKDATFCLSDLEVPLPDNEYSIEKRKVILSFMRSCEICLFTGEWHDNDEPLYLAPELLSDHKPAIIDEHWEPYRADAIHFISKHAILHRAFIQRFIVRAARLTKNLKHIWRDGILFHYQSNYALVEARQEHTGGAIYIQVSGKDKEVLLFLILNELRAIYYYDHKFKLPHLISANGNDFVDVENLENEIKAGNKQVIAQNGNAVSVDDLKIFLPKEKETPLGNVDVNVLKTERKLSDVVPKDDETTPKENKKLKIFISYAHEDDIWRNKLRNAILALEFSSSYAIEVFDDLSLRAGKDINEGLLKEQLEKSQIVIFLVSPHFLRSEYCREKEVPLALEQREKGLAQILPVVIEVLPGYSTLPFGQIASTPKRLQGIKDAPDEKEAWQEVYQALEAMIKDCFQ